MIGFAVLMIGTVIGVIGRMLLESQSVAAIGVLIAIAGMFLTAVGGFRLGLRSDDRADTQLDRELRPLDTALPTNKLPELQAGGFPISVTENTTDLLPVERDK